MKDSIKAKIKRKNLAVGYGPNNPEPAQLKEIDENHDPAADSLKTISDYINKGDC